MVPDSALIFDGTQTLLPVIGGDRVHLAPVTLGYDDGINVQVTNGLPANELIATNLGQNPQEAEFVHTMVQPQRQSVGTATCVSAARSGASSGPL